MTMTTPALQVLSHDRVFTNMATFCYLTWQFKL